MMLEVDTLAEVNLAVEVKFNAADSGMTKCYACISLGGFDGMALGTDQNSRTKSGTSAQLE